MMHDTAFRIGCLVLDTYSDFSKSKILEVGAYDVNGSLRNYAGHEANYVGLDFNPGPGVDIVVSPGEPLPVEDDHFDLVIASSVLEHDSAFWNTFLEMCRKAKSGGYIYINVPSNGVVHRYPQDCWRFYPDAGRALAAWGKSQGQNIKLIESFIANRENDIWNDFVAVFHKAGGHGNAPTQLLYQQIPCLNVFLGDSGEPINPIAETEDMLLVARARIDAEELRRALVEMQKHSELLLQEINDENQRTVANQSQYEIILAQHQNEFAQLSEQVENLRSKLTETDASIFRLSTDRQAAEAEAARMMQALTVAEKAKEHAIAALKRAEENLQMREAHHRDLVMELKDAKEQLVESDVLARKFEWLRKVNALVMAPPRWWESIFAGSRRKRELRQLTEYGLFDAGQYYELYPDVRAEGVDPLRHYIIHGISEGREI
ncbi:methyltransferase domain-containing protein [Sphingobium sp. CECT 9361]|uniref:class I SAM-dependent methyltransferase n=1 Tax=Sphingobium sp. CECT 9361 TaxID=2845384 RepID=UPI001E5D6383|nr:methyltransferase domain-containing protein [Sphingobium sp. CECT 9361]CAH0356996.1 hypothetical protein SPH9361_04645 [Sphingobium sp. CECT 9361]